MNIEIFFIIFTSCLLSHSIAWAFPPIQFLKTKANLTTETFLDLQELKQTTPLSRWQTIHSLACKAVNCSPCMAFWCSVGLSCFNPSIWSIAALVCSYTAASITERIMN